MAYGVIKRTTDNTPGMFKTFMDSFVEERVDFGSTADYDKWYAKLTKEFKEKGETTTIFTAEIFNDKGLVKAYAVEDFIDDPEGYGDSTKIDYNSLEEYCTETWEEIKEMDKLLKQAMKEVK